MWQTNCNRSYAIGTYDLAVAAKAYSIQALEAPATDKLVILLGNFHLEMAYFGALGTYIHESGAEFIFTESGILAEGSLTGFIKGRFYNRCIRIHPILSIAMERCPYQKFLCSRVSQESMTELVFILENAPKEQNEMEGFFVEEFAVE